MQGQVPTVSTDSGQLGPTIRSDPARASSHPGTAGGPRLRPAGARQAYFQTREKLLTRRGVLWLGQTCNIRCHFCYFLDRVKDKEHPEHAFMTLEKAKKICHDLRYKYGNTAIDIQGGEPTIWGPISELVAYCHQIGLHPTLITNGIALARREKCAELQNAGLRDLLVSVQGLGPVHDEIVGSPGASAKLARALDNCADLGIPFRFNCVMSRKAVPQMVDLAEYAAAKGALAVNFIAFNPFEDQAKGKRSTFNVPRYSDVALELNKALDVLAARRIEANVRYFPLCMLEERHRKNAYNFQQLSYDPHEWDYDSWSWTGQQPQRMKWGDTSPHHTDLAAITYNSWVFTARAEEAPRRPAHGVKAAVAYMLAPFPAARDRLKRIYWASLAYRRRLSHLLAADGNSYMVRDELNRDPQVYRDHALVRAKDHCRYQHSPRCDECDVKAICDGFHGDYASLFGSDEARPIHLGKKVTDPLFYIQHQVKIYEPEEAARPFRRTTPLPRRRQRFANTRVLPAGPAEFSAQPLPVERPIPTTGARPLQVIRHGIPAALSAPVCNPLVSVVVTAYNYADFIADCLRSVQAQSYSKFECIVVDDCSTDSTPAVVGTLLHEWEDHRFRYMRLPRNMGQLGAQIRGFRESKGEFVVFLDADDLLFESFIERHLFVHHNIETPVGFTSSNQWTISRDGQLLSKYHTDLVSRLYLSQGIDLEVKDTEGNGPPARGIIFPFWHDKNDPCTWVWGTQSTIMFRRALLQLILPGLATNTEPFRICSDFYIVRFGQLVGGSFVFPEALGCYRRHGGNNFSNNGIIAARMQTGDMRAHPSAAAYGLLAHQVLSDRKEEFLAALGAERYYDLTRYFKAVRSGAVGRRRLHRLLARYLLVRLLGEPTYMRVRLSLGRLVG